MAEGGQLGKYRIVEELGAGGFATVFKAVDTTLDREVALKILHPALLADRRFVQNFRQEAKTLAALRHPQIITIFEVGEIDGRIFIAMELARGISLAKAIASRQRIPWGETLALLKPVCEALDYAHQQNVIHRDLKPANILIDKQRGALLTDFGFAKLLAENSASMSMSGGIVGTPGYIAPEVWENNAADAPVDIYALGCIAYEMLTGDVLFTGQTPMQAMRAHDRGPQLPETWPEETPAGIADVLRKALAREPTERYSSAGALWHALSDLEAQAQADKEAARRAAIAAQWHAEAEPALTAQERDKVLTNVLERTASPSQVAPAVPAKPAPVFLHDQNTISTPPSGRGFGSKIAVGVGVLIVVALLVIVLFNSRTPGLNTGAAPTARPAMTATAAPAVQPTATSMAQPTTAPAVQPATTSVAQPTATPAPTATPNHPFSIEVTLSKHTDAVSSAVFSPDGERILTASYDQTARVWDLSGKQLGTLQGHTEIVNSAVFSPDGQRILTASADHTARVWNLSGKELATLQGHTGVVLSAVFSPDGQRILTASYDQTARVWDLSGKQLMTLKGHTAAVNSAVFSPDGQRILTASDDNTARVWDLSGKQLATLQGHTAEVWSAVFSPDGQRILTASYDQTARVWDLSGKQLATLQGHTDAVNSAVFSPDGQRILTASDDKTARIWR